MRCSIGRSHSIVTPCDCRESDAKLSTYKEFQVTVSNSPPTFENVRRYPYRLSPSLSPRRSCRPLGRPDPLACVRTRLHLCGHRPRVGVRVRAVLICRND